MQLMQNTLNDLWWGNFIDKLVNSNSFWCFYLPMCAVLPLIIWSCLRGRSEARNIALKIGGRSSWLGRVYGKWGSLNYKLYPSNQDEGASSFASGFDMFVEHDFKGRFVVLRRGDKPLMIKELYFSLKDFFTADKMFEERFAIKSCPCSACELFFQRKENLRFIEKLYDLNVYRLECKGSYLVICWRPSGVISRGGPQDKVFNDIFNAVKPLIESLNALGKTSS